MNTYEKFQNNRFFKLGGKLGDVMILSLLWLLCSLPVVTLGASTAALYFSVMKCLRGQSEERPKDIFFRSFKMNARQGLIATVIYLIYGGLLAVDIYVSRHGIGQLTLPAIYEKVAYALILPIAFTLPFIFPYIGRFSNTLKNCFKNSFLLSATHPLHTVAILLTTAAGTLLSVLFPPLVLVLPALCALLCSLMIEKDFELATETRRKALEKAEEERRLAEEQAAEQLRLDEERAAAEAEVRKAVPVDNYDISAYEHHDGEDDE